MFELAYASQKTGFKNEENTSYERNYSVSKKLINNPSDLNFSANLDNC